MVDLLDRLQRRNRAAGFAIGVAYKFFDDHGTYLAAMITYYAFVSVFPLLLLLTTVLSVVLAGHPGLQARIVDSALSQFPIIGDQLGRPRDLSGGTAGVIIGSLLAVYGGLGVGHSVQHAMDTVWAVPRNIRRNPILRRIRSLLLLTILGSALIASTMLAGLVPTWSAFGPLARVAVIVAVGAINTAVVVVGFRFSTSRQLGYRDVVPGALTAAIIWQSLQWFAGLYVAHVVKAASVTNSVFALVLGLLAFLYLIALTLILCAEINAVRVNHLYPRALMTPFSDRVTLTHGDRKTYAGQAKAQRAKGFEKIDVSFDRPGDDRKT